jgi:hypothetical protein
MGCAHGILAATGGMDLDECNHRAKAILSRGSFLSLTNPKTKNEKCMKAKNQIIKPLVVLLTVLAAGPTLQAQTNYSDGHSDFAVSYENNNWFIHYRFDSSTVLNGIANEANPNPLLSGRPSDLRVIVPDADYSRIAIDEDIAGFLSFMNVSPGDTLWYLD